MKSRIRLLTLVVSLTALLLTVSAMLVVLGIFNALLHWDIFGPRLEAFLYGVLFGCLALAAFGFAITLVLAIQEWVRDFKRLVHGQIGSASVEEAPPRQYAVNMVLVAAGMAAIVGVCALANHIVLSHRSRVFDRLAGEHISNFELKLARHVQAFPAPPHRDVPRDLFDTLKALDNLDFVRRTTLYIPDPDRENAMWGYTAFRAAYTNTDGFARFFVARDFEKAMRKALDGEMEDLDEINRRREFIYYRVLTGGDGSGLAVVRMDGNPKANLREYPLGW